MNQREFYDNPVIQKAYTAKKLLDLAFLIQGQVTEVYAHKGMIFPVSCSSTLLFLSNRGPASVTEVARALQHPHQTVAQHIATLGKLHIIDKRDDETDRRRIEYFLTDIGTAQADLLDAYNLEAAEVFERLNRDIGTDLGDVLDIGIAALKRRTMADRFWDLFEQGPAKS
jgi:DNA-binding MarR family transcriptional regulator